MTRTKLLTIICLCVLVGLAGCDGVIRPVSAEVDLEDVSAEGEQVRFVGKVTMDGNGNNATLNDVVLVFIADNGSTLRTIPIGKMAVNGSHQVTRVGFNETVSPLPKEIRLRIGTVEKPAEAGLSATRYKLVDEEELTYSPLSQDEY